jgi:hypothetical protein
MNRAPGFAAVVAWKDGGGVDRSLATDESWRGVVEASFLARKIAWASIPENIDATCMVDWTAEDFDGKGWQAAVRVADVASFFPLWPRTTPLQTEMERTLMPGVTDAGRSMVAGEAFVAEVDQLIQGYHVFRFDADTGSAMEVEYLLPDGTSSGRSSYVARAGAQTWMGGDTFAFTRLRISVKTGRVVLTQAQVFEVRYPFTRVGRFVSSDAMLNQLWSICARTLEVVSEDAYVDCADRERVEWTDCTPPVFECTQVMMAGPDAKGNATVWGDARLLKAMVERIGLTQMKDGQLKAHSCSERWDVHAVMEDRSCDWVNAARQYYDATGDKVFIRRMWPTMVRLMDWFLSKRTERGLVQARDWEVWDNPLRYQVCEGAGLNAFVYWALRDAAYLGAAVGLSGARFAAAASALGKAFQTVLWDEAAGSYTGALFGPGTRVDPARNPGILKEKIVDGRFRPTLQAALFALESGIVPEQRRGRVQQWVVAHLSEATQTMSHFYLYRTLYGMDRAELDVQVLESMRTKWKPQVDSPYQTTWEMLGGPQGHGSKVHCYGMVPGYFLSAYVLGVRRDEPVWTKRIVIEPHLGDLTKAEGVVVTEHGPVPIAWVRGDDGRTALTVNLPEGVRAQVRLRVHGGNGNVLVDGHPAAGAVQGGRVVFALGEGHHSVEPVGN